MHVKEKEIDLYLDKSLSKEKQESIRRHFVDCELCSRKLKEWENIYSTIDMLETDFPLEGLEDKILSKLKSQSKAEAKPSMPNYTKANLIFVSIILFLSGMFFRPVAEVMGWISQHLSNFLFNQGIHWINTAKWQAVDLIGMIQRWNDVEGLLFFASGIMLIVGGTYFSLSNKKHTRQTVNGVK